MRLRKFLFEEEIKLKHGDDPDEKFDAKELARGIEVETEHTDDKEIAKKIAKAHLSEFPGTGNDDGYYSFLKKMEKKAKIVKKD